MATRIGKDRDDHYNRVWKREAAQAKFDAEMQSVEIGKGEMCKSHKPLAISQMAWFSEAERRHKKGMKQTQCKVCKHWFWKDEF